MKVIFEVSGETTPAQLKNMANAMLALSGAALSANSNVKPLHKESEENDNTEKEEKKPAASGKAKVDPGDAVPDKKPGTITLEKLRALVQSKALKGHKDAIVEALEPYGVATVKDLDKKHYAAYYATVEAL